MILLAVNGEMQRGLFAVEIQADGVSAEFAGEQRIFDICDCRRFLREP